MAKQVTVRTPHGEEIDYKIIETLEDLDKVHCHGLTDTLIDSFNRGKTIMVNRMGGYCFFDNEFHTIIS